MYFDVNFIWFQSINVSWNHEFLYVPVPQRFVALLALLSGNICDKEFDICAYYRFFRCDFVRDLIPIWLYSTLCMSVIYLLRIMIDRWHRYDVMHDACNYGGLHLFKHLGVGCKNPTNFNPTYLSRCVDGTTISSTQSLMLQVLVFFFIISCKIFCKNPFNLSF